MTYCNNAKYAPKDRMLWPKRQVWYQVWPENCFSVWQTCYSVMGTWASKTSVMPESWIQQQVTVRYHTSLIIHNLNHKITPT